MRAVILAGGEGTRLRPLTLSVPKPVVPVVDRPFLRHQLDLLATVGITEIVFSVAYRPERVQAVFGDGSTLGCRIQYAVEDVPLGTGGAVRNALPWLDDTTVVFNGDVLTDVDLPGVLQAHRASGARATLVLTPVPDPAAYGLVETAPGGRVQRFLEKPDPAQITTDTINAGIYVLDTATLERIPAGATVSIERVFFPGLLTEGLHVQACVHRGYWIDIGTPEKYLQVHQDILEGRFAVDLDGARRAGGWVSDGADVHEDAALEGPFYVGPGCRVSAGSRLGPSAALTSGVRLESGAEVRRSVLWPGTAVGVDARVEGALLGGVRVGRAARVGPGTVLGEGSVVTDHGRVG